MSAVNGASPAALAAPSGARASPRGAAGETAAQERIDRAERRIVGVRLGVIAAGTVIFPGFAQPAGTAPVLAWALLALAWAYGLALWLRDRRGWRTRWLASPATSGADAVLTVLWLGATGGWRSPFYLAMYLGVVAAAYRGSPPQAWRAAAAYASSYLALLALLGQLGGHGGDLATRLVYLFLAAWLGIVIAQEASRETAARVAAEERLRHEDSLQDAEAWMAVMKESAANMAQALTRAGRLVHFSRSLNILDWDTLRHAARRFIPKLFHVERFSVFLYRSHRRQLVLIAHNHPEWDDLAEPLELPADGGTGIMRDAIATRAPVVVARFEESRYATRELPAAQMRGPALCVPLVAGGQVIGVMNLTRVAGTEIDAGYMGVVKQAADHFALALHNAQLVARINEQAVRDPLTGAFNRRHFYHAIGEMAERAGRRRGTFALMLVDLDGFKQINDRHGHATGDRMLKAVAEQLKTTLRRSDVVCRIGGDEFVALLDGAGGAEAAELAGRICEGVAAIREPVGPGLRVRLDVSIGVAECAHGEHAEELLRRADVALYAAKRHGGSRWVLAEAEDGAVLAQASRA